MITAYILATILNFAMGALFWILVARHSPELEGAIKAAQNTTIFSLVMIIWAIWTLVILWS